MNIEELTYYILRLVNMYLYTAVIVKPGFASREWNIGVDILFFFYLVVNKQNGETNLAI